MKVNLHVLVLSLFFYLGSASSLGSNKLQQVYRFPNGTWLENIAVRPNGNLLVTLANTAELWEVVPSNGHDGQASLVHHFNASMATGITPLSRDVFAVITPNTVWRVDLNVGADPRPVRIATLPAGNLNGMALLNPEKGILAISDSQAGLVWRLDSTTGRYDVMLQDETMEANRDVGPLLGINGIKVDDGYVYYTNTPKRLLCRIPIDPTTGQSRGPSQIISRGALADDLAVAHGVAYLAGLRDNVLYRVFPNGTQEIAAGSRNSTALMGATAAAFGGPAHPHTLYITTGGETAHPVNNTRALGGHIMAFDLRN